MGTDLVRSLRFMNAHWEDNFHSNHFSHSPNSVACINTNDMSILVNWLNWNGLSRISGIFPQKKKKGSQVYEASGFITELKC